MLYTQKFQLSIRDINYANHMDHLALLNYLHETRVRFLREQGYSEIDIDGNGAGLVVVNLQCNYRKECFYGNVLTVNLQLKAISPVKLQFQYQIYNENILVADSDILVVFLDKNKKIIPIPEYLLQLANIESVDK